MRLLIDHRETRVLRILQEVGVEPITLEVKQLPLGDFLLIHNTTGILIERKSVPDFLSSIRSNRLWDQLLRFMKASTLLGYDVKRKLLLIHGTFDQYDTDILWPQIMGAYMEILFVYDIPIILAENDEALGHCMRILIQREKQGKNDLLPKSRWFRKHYSPDLPEMDIRRYVLASLPSVGDVLAGNLLDHFGSITAIANATEKQLQRVEGIGKMKAGKIYQIFH
jgi:DNA excision repair protein ERCC-4